MCGSRGGWPGLGNLKRRSSTRVVVQFEFRQLLSLGRHPDRSRFSGGGKDLARGKQVVDQFHARSLDPLVKARVFGMTPSRNGHEI
jgi:hypothetical protein